MDEKYGKTESYFAAKDFAEFFAGIGLVHEGLRHSGWKCAYANDIEPKKRNMYRGHFGDAPYYHLEDIWNTSEILGNLKPEPFLATASFPCVDLSVAGHWKGFAGEHSSTYFGFLEILRKLSSRRPKIVMLENVLGFLTSRGGEDFGRALRELSALGYWIDAISLDARWFVPQSRPRLFVFGFHDSLASPLLLRRDRRALMPDPWQQAIDFSSELRPPTLLRAFDTLDLPTGWATLELPTPTKACYHLGDLIDTDGGQEWWSPEQTLKHYVMMESPSRHRVDEILRSKQIAVGTAFRRTRGGKARTEVRFDIAGCLRTPKGGSAKQIVLAIDRGKLRMRWMSAVEYARLQGAGNFRITVPPMQALHGFGDAVCVPAIRWLDEHVLTPVFDSAFAFAAAG
jgi:DNA (cytosine-5)-methyltransferase 1